MKFTLITFALLLLSLLVHAQNMDEKIKVMANEIADQVLKSGNKKVAVTAFDYKDCSTEFGKILAEDVTGYLSVSGRNLTVVNQKLLENLLEQNKLTAKGLLEAKNDAAKLGQVSGINALVYGTITTINEEVRISVSIVKLPTLEVFGFTKSSFPLTRGISEMLPCSETKEQANAEDEKGTGDNKATKPNPDCKTKNVCTVCVSNKSTEATETEVWQGSVLLAQTVYIHPNTIKCWDNVPIGDNQAHRWIEVWYKYNGNYIEAKTDKFIVETCKVYQRTFTGR